MSDRKIDSAMEDFRPPKKAVRKIWLEEIVKFNKKYSKSEYPIYLTLPGSEGYDIQMLIESGVVELTEVNSIKENFQNKIIAVESSNKAVLSLQKKYPGLKIEEQNLANIIRGNGLKSWPNPEQEKIFYAHIINLDFDSSINCEATKGTMVFKELDWIYKICLIKKDINVESWKLFFTTNANINNWGNEVRAYISEFINDNIRHDANFSKKCAAHLGENIYKKNTGIVDLSCSLDDLDKQKVLMVFVPKYLSNKLSKDGWKLKTEVNYCYGNIKNNTAPMVTWIIKFYYQSEFLHRPQENYKQSLQDIFLNTGFIDENGVIN